MKKKKIQQKKSIQKIPLISFLLRAGLAIVFFYAGISSLLEPTNWIGFVPDFLELIMQKEIFLAIFSIYQIFLGVGLIADYKTFTLSILSSATLLLILFANIFALEIIFRDIAILFMSLALIALVYKKRE